MEQTAHEKKMEKLKEILDPNFVIEVRAMNKQQIEAVVLKYTKEMERIENEEDADRTLNIAKEQKKELVSKIKDLSAGYKEAKKNAKSKIQFALMTITEQGG